MRNHIEDTAEERPSPEPVVVEGRILESPRTEGNSVPTAVTTPARFGSPNHRAHHSEDDLPCDNGLSVTDD